MAKAKAKARKRRSKKAAKKSADQSLATSPAFLNFAREWGRLMARQDFEDEQKRLYEAAKLRTKRTD